MKGRFIMMSASHRSLILASTFALACAGVEPCKVKVVDAENGWPVPLEPPVINAYFISLTYFMTYDL